MPTLNSKGSAHGSFIMK